MPEAEGRAQLDPGDAPFTRDAPGRPAVASGHQAPVIVKQTPPFSVRMSQFLWIASFAVGGFAVVYYFVIREELLPLIAEVAEEVTAGRSEETYATASDIVFWTMFAVIVATLFMQITLLVSFMGRRPHARWWQLLTLGIQGLVLLLAPEWVALGAKGSSLQTLLLAQASLVLLALLCSILPGAIRWSARRFDLRNGPEGPGSSPDL